MTAIQTMELELKKYQQVETECVNEMGIVKQECKYKYKLAVEKCREIKNCIDMLKAFLGIFILLIATPCFAQVVVVDMDKIATIESSNNPLAYNKGSRATGMFQITPICLKDYNIMNGTSYKLKDMFNPVLGFKVASWYMNKRIPQLLKHFKKQDTLVNRLVGYNCGVGCIGKPLPMETVQYIKKYERIK